MTLQVTQACGCTTELWCDDECPELYAKAEQMTAELCMICEEQMEMKLKPILEKESILSRH